jgi:hypothetical protein
MLKTAGLIALALLAIPSAQACKCVPSPPPTLQDWLSKEILFLGTVTDTGPTLADFNKMLQRKFSAKELDEFESTQDLALKKRFSKRILPKSAHIRLEKAQTDDELELLFLEVFPQFRDEGRPVRFSIQETFKGKPLKTRTVWAGQGFGDCGFAFEQGKSYLVPAYFDDKTGHETTGLCLHILPAEEATQELNFLRANTKPLP